jgi:hypothetical protein
VTEFRLCPIEEPDGSSRTVTVASGDRDFVQLRRALSAPDEQPKTSLACPMYANVPQRVLAKTTSGTLLVHIPVDSCGHYQAAASEALATARQ